MSFSIEEIIIFFINLTWGLWAFFSHSDALNYKFIILSLISAIIILRLYNKKQSLIAFFFPKEVWHSHSAKQDVKYYFFIKALFQLVFIPLSVYLTIVISGILANELGNIFGENSFPKSDSIAATLLYSLLIFIAFDFGFFIAHYLSHKIKLLWCFHKVHHSPSVLIPLTAPRMHPVEILWNTFVTTALIAITSALCQFFFFSGGATLQLFGNNIFLAISYATTHIFRHSHIWIQYPSPLCKFLVSPAQHQLHHSSEERHLDKNFGHLLLIWDQIFKTEYRPKQKEEFKLGVVGMPEEGFFSHKTFASMLLSPFIEAKWEISSWFGRDNKKLDPESKMIDDK